MLYLSQNPSIPNIDIRLYINLDVDWDTDIDKEIDMDIDIDIDTDADTGTDIDTDIGNRVQAGWLHKVRVIRSASMDLKKSIFGEGGYAKVRHSYGSGADLRSQG